MDRHRSVPSNPLPEMNHRQARQAAQKGQIWIARAWIGTEPMSVQNRGAAYGYQMLFASLAARQSRLRSTWQSARPNI
jgi:hypothetical protein